MRQSAKNFLAPYIRPNLCGASADDKLGLTKVVREISLVRRETNHKHPYHGAERNAMG